jgi:hypothetical protein
MKNRQKFYAKSRTLNISFLLMTCLWTLICIVFSSSIVFASIDEISEVYIDATGNNKHEARIKAHELGMQRALLLLANKLNIPTEGLKNIPYYELKSAFTPKVILNEVSLLEKYNATVTYSYDKGRLYSLLVKHGDQKINDLFYEFMVIPVFKQRNVLNIWEKDKRWNDLWSNSRKILDTHKIYYPEKNLFSSQKVTQENLFSLKYDDFIDIFHTKLFKNVMVITAEFFTNRRTGESSLHVKKYIWTPTSTKAELIEEEHDLSTWDDIPFVVDLVIDKVIDDHGQLRLSTPEEDQENGNIFTDAEEQKPIIMNFDVFDDEELNLVVEKLEQVEQIESFAIEHDYNTRYKILIYTNSNEYELAEGLYLNGLSYKIHGQLYNLIDIKKGG